ncbi:NAD(P)H-dependent flavin oxidoreductase [Streptomyces sp. NPDC006879]|uniref:NAD(P)H-dependent flavin oxidoreductase n=1 Tax=Streptomyces sp. NPDC006879 TaxID=3364767 RepID=UPI00367EDF12
MSTSRLSALLGIEHPLIQGPFGGGLSSVELAAAVSEGGGLGSYGAHVLEPRAIGPLVAQIRSATSRPFAVNLWVPQDEERGAPPDTAELAAHTERLRPYYEELGVPGPPPAEALAHPAFQAQAAALLAARPPVVSFVMGVPPRDLVEAAHARGIALIGTATTVEEALALEAAGMDAVVASGSDAGGHRGAFLRPVRESLVGTFSLVPQVADALSVPVIAAGGIADGRGIAAALTLGADGVQIGTGFLATTESGASAVHKRALGGPEARTTVLTRLFSGRTARGIPNAFVRDLAAHEDEVPAYPVQNALMRPIRAAAISQGRADRASLWAGQAAALSGTSRTAREYLDQLVAELAKCRTGKG